MRSAEDKAKYDVQYKREHLKRVPLDLQLEEYERVKAYTENTGETVNGFIKRAIREAMGKGNKIADQMSSYSYFLEAKQTIEKAKKT